MEFKSDFYYKGHSEESKSVQYPWNPSIKDWRDIIEIYLSISRNNFKNRLAMFKLQLWILDDYVGNIKLIDQLKIDINNVEAEIKNGNNQESVDKINYLKRKISDFEHLNRILKDVMDGVAWRSFGFNRAILYLLADKESIKVLRPDEGLINSILVLSEMFMNPQKTAILNDLTSFLRVGDITVLNENGDKGD